MCSYKGTIIEESLADKSILSDIKVMETKVEDVTIEHETPYLEKWTLHTGIISKDEIKRIAEEVSKSFDTTHNHWYADFKNDKYHYVIYPNKIFAVDRTRPGQYKEVTRYGISLGIPEHQLDFTPEIVKPER